MNKHERAMQKKFIERQNAQNILDEIKKRELMYIYNQKKGRENHVTE